MHTEDIFMCPPAECCESRHCVQTQPSAKASLTKGERLACSWPCCGTAEHVAKSGSVMGNILALLKQFRLMFDVLFLTNSSCGLT